MGSGGFKKYAPSDIENKMFFWVNFKSKNGHQTAYPGVCRQTMWDLKTVFGAFFSHFGYLRVIPNECWKIRFFDPQRRLRPNGDALVRMGYACGHPTHTSGNPGTLNGAPKGVPTGPCKKLEQDSDGLYPPPGTPQGSQGPKHDFWDFWPAGSPVLGAVSRKKWFSSEIPPNAP